MQPRAAIFDFDGTIADTFEEVVQLLNSLASEFGYRPAQPDEIELLRSMPPGDVAKRLGVAWHKIPLIVTRARKELGRKMANVQPFDGIAEALAALRARDVQIGLLTSNNRRNVDLFLARNPIPFDFISTGSGLWSKHRRLARLMRQRGLTPERTAYVGDELRDVEAARTLGIRAVSVAWGYTNPQLLSAQSPDLILERPSELASGLDAILSGDSVLSS
jgi:phosphoglycolate phosphatase